MDEFYTRFDGVFFEKTRLSVMTVLFKEGELSFNQIKDWFGTSDGSIYAHLEKLRSEGYIERTRERADGALASTYKLTAKGRETFVEYMSFLEGLLKSNERPV